MTCDDFQRSYLEGETTDDGRGAPARLRRLSTRHTRARCAPRPPRRPGGVGAPGTDLRGQVIAAVVSAAGPSSVSRRSRRWRWIAGAAAALVVVVVAASLVLTARPGRRRRLGPHAVRQLGGAGGGGGGPRVEHRQRHPLAGRRRGPRARRTERVLRDLDVVGLRPACASRDVPRVGTHRVVVGSHPGRLPTHLDHARARRRRRAAHGRDDRRHAWLVTRSLGASTSSRHCVNAREPSRCRLRSSSCHCPRRKRYPR